MSSSSSSSSPSLNGTLSSLSSSSVLSTRSSKFPSNTTAFLNKLWFFVNDQSTDHLIGWSQSGCSFVISDQNQFSHVLLPLYFKHSKWNSFVRQLNFYGFRKVFDPSIGQRVGPSISNATEFYNINFKRGQEQLLAKIKRKRSPSNSIRLTVNETFFNEARIMMNELKLVRDEQKLAEPILNSIQEYNKSLVKEVTFLCSQQSREKWVLDKLVKFLSSLMHDLSIRVARNRATLIGGKVKLVTNNTRSSSNFSNSCSKNDGISGRTQKAGSCSNRQQSSGGVGLLAKGNSLVNNPVVPVGQADYIYTPPSSGYSSAPTVDHIADQLPTDQTTYHQHQFQQTQVAGSRSDRQQSSGGVSLLAKGNSLVNNPVVPVGQADYIYTPPSSGYSSAPTVDHIADQLPTDQTTYHQHQFQQQIYLNPGCQQQEQHVPPVSQLQSVYDRPASSSSCAVSSAVSWTLNAGDRHEGYNQLRATTDCFNCLSNSYHNHHFNQRNTVNADSITWRSPSPQIWATSETKTSIDSGNAIPVGQADYIYTPPSSGYSSAPTVDHIADQLPTDQTTYHQHQFQQQIYLNPGCQQQEQHVPPVSQLQSVYDRPASSHRYALQ